MEHFKTGDLVWIDTSLRSFQVVCGKIVDHIGDQFFINVDGYWYIKKPDELRLLSDEEAMLWKLEN
jgi:hypothetical protein